MFNKNRIILMTFLRIMQEFYNAGKFPRAEKIMIHLKTRINHSGKISSEYLEKFRFQIWKM